MKKVYALFLVMLVLLSGCSKEKEHIVVEDACCPYEISPRENGQEVLLQDGELTDLRWEVETVPQDICTVNAQKQGQYHIAGTQEGAAQVTFTALQRETVRFVLTLVVHVDGEKRVTLTSYEHRQREEVSQEDGLQYNWSVDVDGILTFSFLNTEDRWSVHGDGEGICTLLEKMETPGGCKFTAQQASVGETVISLVGETTQRTVCVTVRVDEQGSMEVLSVQEQ